MICLAHIKTKLRNTCEKYSKIRVPYKYRKIVETLSKNSRIVIMKQDKGKGVVLMGRTVYLEKCLDILDTKQFTKLSTDPTMKTEERIQRVLRKIKRSFSTQEYSTISPTGSCPGKFYGTAKVHKLPENGNVNYLPIRPIVSNIENPTYQLAKYLAKLLSPLSQSQYTVKSTKDFIGKMQNVNVPHGFNKISFDVKSLFSSVPLEETINVALDRIYHRKEIDTSISKNDMRNLLLLCTKNVHFCFGGGIYQQNDGVAMGSPLGLVLAGIVMVELETRIIPMATDSISHWRRYVDNAFVFIKKGYVEHVLARLNSFHKNIQFTYELENQNKLPFLDVLLIRRGNNIETTVYRKSANNDIYLN